ncbi:hypothetical protein [uncultured Thiohalocapsa sp.]|uniref:hypothetical protein n=1 Tax=uncultured Thiohalocapsa sp. TaxID=768990 RepID=UPI0025EEA5B2|nr:hypothetical protein [uncultured Thiohalocapsa sp.]
MTEFDTSQPGRGAPTGNALIHLNVVLDVLLERKPHAAEHQRRSQGARTAGIVDLCCGSALADTPYTVNLPI